MERRAILAVVISLVILLGYERILHHFYPPLPATETATFPGPDAPEDRVSPEPAAPPPPVAGSVAEAALQPSKQIPAEPEQRIEVDTPLYSATFSTYGARLVSFRLKKYRTTVQPDSPPQETISPAPDGEAPVGVELRGLQGIEPISDAGASYIADKPGLQLAEGDGTIEFTWDSGRGRVRKQFTFHADSYAVNARVEVANLPSGINELMLSWPKAIDAKPKEGAEVVFDKAAYLNGKKRIDHPFKDLEKGEIVEGDIRWTGYSGSHFFAALALDEARNQRLWLKLRGETVEQKFLVPISGNSVNVPVEMFIGPKDVDALEHAGHNFSRALDLGWFSFIAIPLLHILQLSHRITGNYGIDIILLTVIIKVLFLPLTRTSFKSMQAMQKLQPQMQAIREKLKDTPEQMNKEIMELYRRHKVNPFGGCLPMLLQIPVFIGLYTALMNTVELRHAPFMLWINDLAAPDRLGSIQLPFVQHPGIPVLTLLMGASMFLQQWMTPSMGDPSQRQIMMIMPLMFTFMFVNFPSGLSLYWLVNNVLTIAQQYHMNRGQPRSGSG